MNDPSSPIEQPSARLVLDGLTHKEVGAQLYISPKTVEHHVGHILTKLGFANHAQVAAWVTAQPHNQDS